MKRVPIRNGGDNSRVMDYICSDEGKEYIEAKDGKTKKRLPVPELYKQIEEARKR